jgi:hypothetical protein
MVKTIDPFKSPRLHRQRKGRRKTVTVFNQEELAVHFEVAQDQVKPALIAAGWPYHEDANGGLWALSRQASTSKDQGNGGNP